MLPSSKQRIQNIRVRYESIAYDTLNFVVTNTYDKSLIANEIIPNNKERYIDIGERIDEFVLEIYAEDNCQQIGAYKFNRNDLQEGQDVLQQNQFYCRVAKEEPGIYLIILDLIYEKRKPYKKCFHSSMLSLMLISELAKKNLYALEASAIQTYLTALRKQGTSSNRKIGSRQSKRDSNSRCNIFFGQKRSSVQSILSIDGEQNTENSKQSDKKNSIFKPTDKLKKKQKCKQKQICSSGEQLWKLKNKNFRKKIVFFNDSTQAKTIRSSNKQKKVHSSTKRLGFRIRESPTKKQQVINKENGFENLDHSKEKKKQKHPIKQRKNKVKNLIKDKTVNLKPISMLKKIRRNVNLSDLLDRKQQSIEVISDEQFQANHYQNLSKLVNNGFSATEKNEKSKCDPKNQHFCKKYKVNKSLFFSQRTQCNDHPPYYESINESFLRIYKENKTPQRT